MPNDQGTMMRRIIGIVRAIWALPAAAHETHISLRVGLDPETASFLADRGERVIVASWFYGEPVPTGKLPPDDLGLLFPDSKEASIWPQDQTVVVGGRLSKAPFESVRTAMVNVNVYTSRLTDDDNLLDCGLVDGPIQQVMAATQIIFCKLINP